MDKNTGSIDLTARLVELADKDSRDEILRLLCAELKSIKLKPESIIYYCSCGYPLSYGTETVNHKNEIEYSCELIKEILNEEADFDHYRLEYYCPKCGVFLTEVQC